MKWTENAEKEIGKAPFFIRKKIRRKVEEYARKNQKSLVEAADLKQLKKDFLSRKGMEKQIRGYDISLCFGESDCPNSANACKVLAEDITVLIEKADLLSFLKNEVKTGLKFHHEFKIALADCPNACSRPQIADIGIIGAVIPFLSDQDCTACGACVETCREHAVYTDNEGIISKIDVDACVKCGACIPACPAGTIQAEQAGYRVMLGGRLGRHPRLAMEMEGIYSTQGVLSIVKKCLEFYKINSKGGVRFSHILESTDQIASML